MKAFRRCGSWCGDVCRWIGNAADDGRAATVFARLKVPALDGSGKVEDHGVHGIVVPLRAASGQSLPGVDIRDCGYKVSLLACLLHLHRVSGSCAWLHRLNDCCQCYHLLLQCMGPLHARHVAGAIL